MSPDIDDVCRQAHVQKLLDVDHQRISMPTMCRSQPMIIACPRPAQDRFGNEVACTRQFQRPHRLHEHVKNDLAHQKEGDHFLCVLPGNTKLKGICGKLFKTPGTLRTHVLSWHGKRPNGVPLSTRADRRPPRRTSERPLRPKDIDADFEEDEGFESEEPF